jgi:flagellar biosynthesis/type III secretory pathway protein FliH
MEFAEEIVKPNTPDFDIRRYYGLSKRERKLQRISDQAYYHGFDDGRRVGYGQGFEKGRAEGHAKGYQEALKQFMTNPGFRDAIKEEGGD